MTATSLPGFEATSHRPDPVRNILVELRERTRVEHAAIERALDLSSDALTLATYRHTLERLYGYYCPLEAQLHRSVGLAEHGRELIGRELIGREKTPWLVQDLGVLRTHASAPLPMCHELPTLDGLSAALGCWYVLEGASLGGQIISRQVRASLGMTGETGARFFQGYAERTGEMWKRFRAVLTAWVVTPEEQERSIRAALGTFRTLRRWCRQEPADDR